MYDRITTLWANSADDKLMIFFSLFLQKTGFDTACKLSPLETICMKCQILFPGKNGKNISIGHLLKILPRVLSIKIMVNIHTIPHTVRQNLTEFWPFWTPFPIRFSNLTEFSYHLISYFLKN